jgi:Fic family protein
VADDDIALQPLSAEEIAELDAAYKPFPAFDDWPQDSPTVPLWEESCRRFGEVAQRADEDAVKRAREISLRAAAFDTGAIEGLYSTNRGLTFTVAEQSALWEQKVEAQGPDALTLFAAQLRAFELVLDHVTDWVPEVTQAWIRRIHEEITAPQETYLVHTAVGAQKQALPQGEYKSHPNHVRTADGDVHAYAPVASTQSEMERFISELEKPNFRAANPIIQASFVHYAFVAIHPFADGNGRVARALASVFTYRFASVPLLILHDQRDRYFEALASADRGDAQAFVDFMGRAAKDAVELAWDNLETALAPQPEQIIDRFDELNRVDPTSQERNEVALELARWVRTSAGEMVEGMGGESVNLDVEPEVSNWAAPPDGYREIPEAGTKGIRITATTLMPKKIQLHRRVDFFVSDDPRVQGSFLMRVEEGPSSLALDLEDLWPNMSAISQNRVENFIRRTLGVLLKDIQDEVLERQEP